MGEWQDWLSMDRRNHDSVTRGGMDSPLRQACGRMLFNKGRPLDLLGGGNEGMARMKDLRISPC